MEQNKPKVIAYYLPQYYPFPENNEWWGKGFTEWTNVGKTRPLFKGHYQPKVPADLGYYDLRLPEVAEQQAELAKRAGVYGFCYWHYWFGNGKELLDMPFKRALETGKPDFPFCLGWAAEGWMAKTWNKDSNSGRWLIQQEFPGEDDNLNHFNQYLKAFKDPRYIKVDGRPFFLLYGLKNFPDIQGFMDQWNRLIKEAGVADSFYFVGLAKNMDELNACPGKFDATSVNNLYISSYFYKGTYMKGYRFIERIIGKLRKRPIMIDYREVVDKIWYDDCEREDFIPTIIPNWDHTPRSGYNGTMFYNTTPELWDEMCKKVVGNTLKKNNKFIMLKSWNEWGEGNYMEPDLKYGTKYIDILAKYTK
ncbi:MULTISPECIES: glycoside hydrolase family 99-like domain-containing protein [unclassified Bacteroides]|uniref:glycosyltransferase WbsX family protein n=1 Tax=unclassified Bacteroides TaxID=2646097 RepID=UPI0004E166A1|nr:MULTISPECIES: glycoside hydrolase family 99-like domain-containing protein [unclassified Bacteroides]